VILGLTCLSYAINLFIFAAGRLMTGAADRRHHRPAIPTRCRRRWC
jgi:multisubunit Na+/H+ antiporter MnhC subunit